MYILILYTINGFWGIYTSTQVGRFYAHEILDSSHFFYEIIEYDIVYFSFSTTVISLLTCLTVTAIGKLLGLNLYFYYSRGVITRLILWAVPLILLSAYAIQGFFEFENFLTAIAGAFIPTFCLHPACFRFVENSFPTLFDIFGNTSRLLSFLFDLSRRLILKVLPPDIGKTKGEIDSSEIIEDTETQVKVS
jgi:uncharacterized membrane protein YvlD (DUF360 family)